MAHTLGLPDELPVTFCPHCAADVTPRGRGQCPRCGRVLKLSFLARRHPVNQARRKQILERLVREYNPTTMLQHAWCEDLAGIREQLENLKPGSTEWQRLGQMQQQLGATLEESRSAREPQSPTDYADLTIDELIERTTAILRRLLELRDDEARVKAASPSRIIDGVVVERGIATPAPLAAPEPACPYCQRTCVGPEHHAYSVLHWNDPTEVAKRDEQATRVMLKRMAYGHA